MKIDLAPDRQRKRKRTTMNKITKQYDLDLKNIVNYIICKTYIYIVSSIRSLQETTRIWDVKH
jgi:hypothetical protein